MLDIGVIGDSAFNLGFQLAGVRKSFDSEADPSTTMKKALADSSIGILIVDSKLMEKLDERLQEEVNQSTQPVCLQLSTESGAEDALRKMIRKSIGIDLWSEK